MRIFAGVVAEADALERGEGLGLGLAARQRFQAEGDIVEDGEMREQREVLEHQADAALLRRHEAVGPATSWPSISTRPEDRALDAGGDPEQGRLAAARRPEQAEDLRRRDVEADMVERQRRRRSGATRPRR